MIYSPFVTMVSPIYVKLNIELFILTVIVMNLKTKFEQQCIFNFSDGKGVMIHIH